MMGSEKRWLRSEKSLGVKALAEVAHIVRPETILGWNKRLIAKKFDGSKKRRHPGRPRVDEGEPATRTNRTARLTVSFDQVTVNGRAYPMRGTVTRAIEGEGIRGETGRIATGAGVGAILGGLLGGGFKGTLAGILIGAGGTIAATEGRQVELPQGSVLRVRIDSPLLIDTIR